MLTDVGSKHFTGRKDCQFFQSPALFIGVAQRTKHDFDLLTGFHGMHVTGGVIYNTSVLAAVSRGRYQAKHVEIAGLYWHFVDLVWILIFTFVYLI